MVITTRKRRLLNSGSQGGDSSSRVNGISKVAALAVSLVFFFAGTQSKSSLSDSITLDSIGITSAEPPQRQLTTDVTSTIASQTNTGKPKKSHMLQLDPLPYSLHPEWKLWSEMTTEQQDAALDKVGIYLTKYGKLIKPTNGKLQGENNYGNCKVKTFKNGHSLCEPKPENCTFFSFGINDDPSFDIALAEEWDCRGFSADPTVEHPSKLHPKVTFHSVAASMLSDNEERLINKGGAVDWWSTSMPKLRYFLGLDHVSIVKLDCEGCEYAFARDVLREDPYFLHVVDQFSIESHVTKTWLNTREELYYFGLHFALLEEAGFEMVWSSVFGCSKRHEITGCIPEMEKYGFPCGHKPWPGHPKVVRGYSCHEFTWNKKKKTAE
mmetsp:Transcript_30170/g.72415  ORF Transcript_30170/g.72415 Transcript_30170/m.72415 type:complete len:381 (-) Transcript_30170:283-1425(-)